MNQVRVQILLEPQQHTALKKAAKRANKSMSELVRQITDEYLAKNAPDQEDEVLQALKNRDRIARAAVGAPGEGSSYAALAAGVLP